METIENIVKEMFKSRIFESSKAISEENRKDSTSFDGLELSLNEELRKMLIERMKEDIFSREEFAEKGIQLLNLNPPVPFGIFALSLGMALSLETNHKKNLLTINQSNTDLLKKTKCILLTDFLRQETLDDVRNLLEDTNAPEIHSVVSILTFDQDFASELEKLGVKSYSLINFDEYKHLRSEVTILKRDSEEFMRKQKEELDHIIKENHDFIDEEFKKSIDKYAEDDNNSGIVRLYPSTLYKFGVTVEEVLISVFDVVDEGDTIFEFQTDKATMEFPANFTGVIVEVYVKKGDEIRANQKLCRIIDSDTVDEEVVLIPVEGVKVLA